MTRIASMLYLYCRPYKVGTVSISLGDMSYEQNASL